MGTFFLQSLLENLLCIFDGLWKIINSIRYYLLKKSQNQNIWAVNVTFFKIS